jgi:large subunit ribosomal protein L28
MVNAVLSKRQLVLKFSRNYSKKEVIKWLNANCGKTTTFGHNRSFSCAPQSYLQAQPTRLVMEKGHKVHKVLCTKCIKASAKPQRKVQLTQQSHSEGRDFCLIFHCERP